MILGTMIPIPKDKKKSLCSSSNYRAIALSSIFSKILDWIILIKEEYSLCSSELQFGFKKGLSTTQCTFSMLEVIDYYNVNQARVQKFVRGGAQNLNGFFFAFQFFRGGGAQLRKEMRK